MRLQVNNDDHRRNARRPARLYPQSDLAPQASTTQPLRAVIFPGLYNCRVTTPSLTVGFATATSEGEPAPDGARRARSSSRTNVRFSCTTDTPSDERCPRTRDCVSAHAPQAGQTSRFQAQGQDSQEQLERPSNCNNAATARAKKRVFRVPRNSAPRAPTLQSALAVGLTLDRRLDRLESTCGGQVH